MCVYDGLQQLALLAVAGYLLLGRSHAVHVVHVLAEHIFSQRGRLHVVGLALQCVLELGQQRTVASPW